MALFCIVLYCDTQADLPHNAVAIAGIELLRKHSAVKTSVTI